jgi:uncharacterized protein with FMN-binding domain
MRRVFLAAISTVAGLTMLLSFKSRSTTSVPTHAALAPATTGTTVGGTSGSTGTSASPSTTATTGTQTVTGTAGQTRYGPVQVQITVTNGQLSAVNAIEYPTGSGRDAQINSYAIPQLNQEAVAAKSAKIDMISGATYTSTGYINSLQSALTKAGLA